MQRPTDELIVGDGAIAVDIKVREGGVKLIEELERRGDATLAHRLEAALKLPEPSACIRHIC